MEELKQSNFAPLKTLGKRFLTGKKKWPECFALVKIMALPKASIEK